MPINHEYSVTTSARRAQIVQATIDTLADLGYDQASFARITERAGLSSPRMISYHFAGKQDLMRQIVIDVFELGAKFMVERIEVEDTSVRRLRAYLEANLRFLRDHPREVAALTEIGPHLRTESGSAYTSAGAQEPSVHGLAELLADGQRAGEFREFNTRSMAVMIRGAIEAAAQRVNGQSSLDFEDYARELVTVFALGSKAEPGNQG